MQPTAINQLINNRIEELGISYADLVERAGYTNKAKGLRRLDELFNSNFESARGLIERLPVALELPRDDISQAIETTKRTIAELVEAEWRAAFKPNARILTEENGRPRQIALAAISNAGQYVCIEFPEGMPAEGYLEYVLQVLPKVLEDVSRYFYAPLGFVINWNPDSATKYSLDGARLEDLPRAFRGGVLSFSLK